jgi:hypothetical protein
MAQGDMRILVLASGTSEMTLHPFYLKRDRDKFDRLPKVVVDAPPARPPPGSPDATRLDPTDIRILSLCAMARPTTPLLRSHLALTHRDPGDGRAACRYRAVYIVHVNPALPRPVMTLFLLTREAATKRAVIPLDARRPFVLNTLDNLLVVHSLGSQVWGSACVHPRAYHAHWMVAE